MRKYTTQSDALNRITALADERQALWAKAGAIGALSPAEQGRLTDIRHSLDRLWDQRRQEKAGAKAGKLSSAAIRRRDHCNRRGRMERRAVSWSH